jgi:transposase/IS5 family transposase
MARYKPIDRGPMLLPVVLEEQIQPGTFEFALDRLVDTELDLSELDKRFKNDKEGASAYDPRVMLKIVLLGYSRGLISSRRMEQACQNNIVFMAISGDSRPSYAHIAKFVRHLGADVQVLFTQVLMTCDRLGLIGRTMFAIDGVKLPSNASKERSGTHAELAHRAERLEKAVAKMVAMHQAQDEHGTFHFDAQRQMRIDELTKEAQATRDFIATSPKRLNKKGQEIKTNVTDPQSAKMATSKGVIQGYAAQAAVDAEHQIIVAAAVTGSGSEQSMLLPMVQATTAVREDSTLITADAGYFSDENIKALHDQGIPALIADNAMRQRDERFAAQDKYKDEVLHDKRPTLHTVKFFKPEHFTFNDDNTATCPAGKVLSSNGSIYTHRTGAKVQQFRAKANDCQACKLKAQCLKNPKNGKGRMVTKFGRALADANDPSQKMRTAIDSSEGRRLYSQRIATVEPVFANIRHHKGMDRFTLRGKLKVGIQWVLYCLVHNIEKMATKTAYAQ